MLRDFFQKWRGVWPPPDSIFWMPSFIRRATVLPSTGFPCRIFREGRWNCPIGGPSWRGIWRRFFRGGWRWNPCWKNGDRRHGWYKRVPAWRRRRSFWTTIFRRCTRCWKSMPPIGWGCCMPWPIVCTDCRSTSWGPKFRRKEAA